MGIKVPKLAWNPGDRSGINYSLIDTNAYMDEAVEDFNKVMENLFHLAEIEGSIESLAVEIEKTKRRVNALEYIFLPRLKATQKYIEMRLQEREREDFFRRKKIKSIMEQQRAEEERLLGESLV
jgi:V/A-type H+-transporting ATPase subunit D